MNNLVFSKLFKKGIQKIEFTQMRFAKSPGQSQRGARKTHIVYSLTNPGEYVDERTVIGTQKRIEHHPGLNVGINPRDKSLYSICSGTVYYSFERFVPNLSNGMVQNYYSRKFFPKYVKYIHVIPDKSQNQFKMIDII